MEGIYKTLTVLKIVVISLLLLSNSYTKAQSQFPTKAAFTQDKTLGCLPLVVNFTNSSQGNIVAYHWDFGNSNTSSQKNPGAIYTVAGNYTVKLIVTDASGSKDTLTKNVLIKALANPTAGFSVPVYGGCQGQTFQFTDTTVVATGKLKKWYWNFGDGAADTTQNPAHTFTNTGVYGISLIVTDENGCKSFVNHNQLIKITQAAQVAIATDNTGGCNVPQKVNFENKSSINTSATYTYKWKFGTGDSSLQENPSYTYTKMGLYTVQLTVTDDNNCANQLNLSNYISLGKTTANFALSNTKGCVPFTPQFQNQSVGVPTDAAYVWYFSNGDSAIGKTPNYTFTSAGTYSVTLKITSPSGCNDSLVKKDILTVLPAPASTFAHGNTISCAVPHTITFGPTNNNTNAWAWDFGDGETSTLKNPTKIYTQGGVYTVQLTITDNNGCQATSYKKNLVIVGTQKAQFTPSVNGGCVPLTVDFANNSESFFGIQSYAWDFGNGKTASTAQSKITYNQAGTYYPQLIIKDNNGCIDTMVFDSIPVGIKTNPDFYTNRRAGCINDMRKVEFYNTTNTSTQKVDSFYWDFVTLNSHDVNPIIDYVAYPGVYTVQLISYSNSCTDTIVKKDYITIYMPDADAIITEDPCKLDTVNFKNNSIGGHIFNWTLNGEAIANKAEFNRFLTPDTYHLELFVKDTVTGCTDTKEYMLTIRQPLIPGFTVSVDSVCANTNFLVQDTTHGSISSTWLFGEGVPAVGKVQTPFYYNPGVYDITLQTTDIYGCQETLTKQKTIKILGPDYTPIVTPNKGCFPLNAQLIKTGYSAHGIEEVTWSTGNQQLKSMADSIPYLFSVPTNTMHTEGVRVFLTIKDKLGCQVSRNATVKISKPVADISFSAALLCKSTDVVFLHNTNTTQNINPFEYTWLVDGTENFTAENNLKNFSQKGTHSFKLSVKEKELGCTATNTVNYTVITKTLKAGFSIDETKTTCPPLVSNFTSANTTENTAVAAMEWNFGDGAASQLLQPVKSYFYPGNYDISYKIIDVDGCQDSITIKSQIQIGGPVGQYTLDKTKDCVPFDVNIIANSKNAKTINWDFGNGLLGNGSNVKTTYDISGVFSPTMVLEDSAGCKVVYPVQPITGLASTQPVFSYTGKCLYDTFSFTNTINTLAGNNTTTTQFVWLFNTTDSIVGNSATKNFSTAGKHTVSLKAIEPNGCTSIATEEIEIKALKADYIAQQNPVCRFSYINLQNKSIAQAGIETLQWGFGDGRTDSIETPLYFYQNAGNYKLSLVIKDKVGCFDTAKNALTIEVFDTLTPPTPLAHRVTVQENNTIHLEFSPYLNRDFNSYIIFRSTKGSSFVKYKTINNPLDTIFIDETVNTFAQSYTYKVYSQTQCDKLSVANESQEHTSVLLHTQADTNKVYIKWTAYKGWDNLGSYSIYRKCQNTSTFVQIATVDAATNQYTDEDVLCGYTYHYFVYAIQNSAAALQSRSNNSSAAPVHKSTVQPAYLVRATVEEDNHVLVEFAKPAFIKSPIASYTIQKSVDGVSYQNAFTTTESNVAYRDYKTDVHHQNYYYRVIATDICGDISAASNIGKTIVLKATADDEDNVNVNWSHYQKWDEGIAHYEIEQLGGNGFFEKTGINNAIDSTFVDESNLFNQISKVCYRVKAVSNNGTVSYSNTDCASGHSTLFVPNAFTPNGDGLNNKFVIVGAYIKDFELNIYNRYGEKIYTSYSIEQSWDGTYKNETVQEGAYLYVVNAKGLDYKTHNYSGTVTLLR